MSIVWWSLVEDISPMRSTWLAFHWVKSLKFGVICDSSKLILPYITQPLPIRRQLSDLQLTPMAPCCDPKKAPFPRAHPVCSLSVSHLDWYLPQHQSSCIIVMNFATSIYCLYYYTQWCFSCQLVLLSNTFISKSNFILLQSLASQGPLLQIESHLENKHTEHKLLMLNSSQITLDNSGRALGLRGAVLLLKRG